MGAGVPVASCEFEREGKREEGVEDGSDGATFWDGESAIL